MILNFSFTSSVLRGFSEEPLGAGVYFSYIFPSFMCTLTRALKPASESPLALTFFLNVSSSGSRTFDSVRLSVVTFPSARASAARKYMLNLPSWSVLGSTIPAASSGSLSISISIPSTSEIGGFSFFWISTMTSIVECTHNGAGYILKQISESKKLSPNSFIMALWSGFSVNRSKKPCFPSKISAELSSPF